MAMTGFARVGLRPVGPWSLLANLDEVAFDLVSEERQEPPLHGELREQIDEVAQGVRAQGKVELANALERARSTLDRIAAVSAVRRAELTELGRISRELPSLLFAEPRGPSTASRLIGPSLAKVRNRAASGTFAVDQPLAGRSVVIVNEDQEVAWSQRGVLLDAGAHVRLAYDGQDALDLSRQTVPDLLLADAFMSGLDGVAMVRAFRRHALLRDVGIVLVGARRGLLSRLASLGACADGYLMDKADASSILSCAARAIEPRRQLECQLTAGGDVTGNLAIVAPRTLLVSTARLRPDTKILLGEGGETYEARLGAGSLLTLRASIGPVGLTTDREAMRKCLALRHGHFCVVSTETQGWQQTEQLG